MAVVASSSFRSHKKALNQYKISVLRFLFVCLQQWRRLGLAILIVWMLYDMPAEDDVSRGKSMAATTTTGASTQSQISTDIMDINDGFLGSPASTLIQQGSSSSSSCQCDLVSVDCLDVINDCLPGNYKQKKNRFGHGDEEDDLKRIHEGMVYRKTLRSTAQYWPSDNPRYSDYHEWAPLGKALQVATIATWRSWLKHNSIPLGYVLQRPSDAMANATMYLECQNLLLEGRACFFNDFSHDMETTMTTAASSPSSSLLTLTLGLEQAAIRKYGKVTVSKKMQRQFKKMQQDPYEISPYDYLMGFCQFARIVFSLRTHMLQIYASRMKTIPAADSPSSATGQIVRVSLHVRRGDACEHQLEGYAAEASPLGSHAQMSGKRLCYATRVYVDALKRIYRAIQDQRLQEQKQMHVYVATDHMLSLLDEIKTIDNPFYDQVTWHYVEYPRQMFNYSTDLPDGSNFIEFSSSMAVLGETAAMDLHHLSHGQVFVGHLGSRFGKLAWFQATARQYSFVPFYTVDGHAVCCDIDEVCRGSSSSSAQKPFPWSMENCLTFSRENSKTYVQDPDEYWAKALGSTVRWQAARDEFRERAKRGKRYDAAFFDSINFTAASSDAHGNERRLLDRRRNKNKASWKNSIDERFQQRVREVKMDQNNHKQR